MFENIYRDKTVLITGSTGFKGAWLSVWLHTLGANVFGFYNDIPTNPSHAMAIKLDEFVSNRKIDIRNLDDLQKQISDVKPDFIFHMAAQALVRPAFSDPISTMNTNAIGSANVLEAVRHLNKHVVCIMITSDKVYENKEWVWGYRENDALGGKDPYSASKAMAELAIYSYVHSFFLESNCKVRLGVTRAGNVIGGGDWAVDRIVPDCMRSWFKNDVVEVRNPASTRPWQHVLEPLSGYLRLGTCLFNSKIKNGEQFNFGPDSSQNVSVELLIEEMERHWKCAKHKDISDPAQCSNEAGLLSLNCDKANAVLQWQPTLNFDETVGMTVDWYRQYYEETRPVIDITKDQIENYICLARERGLSWTA